MGFKGQTGSSMVPAGRRKVAPMPEFNRDECPTCRAGKGQPCVEYRRNDKTKKYRVVRLQKTHRTTAADTPVGGGHSERLRELTEQNSYYAAQAGIMAMAVADKLADGDVAGAKAALPAYLQAAARVGSRNEKIDLIKDPAARADELRP